MIELTLTIDIRQLNLSSISHNYKNDTCVIIHKKTNLAAAALTILLILINKVSGHHNQSISEFRLRG